ncbi:MAG TPA: nucleotide exchange factor GrpE [Bacilli bacterium]
MDKERPNRYREEEQEETQAGVDTKPEEETAPEEPVEGSNEEPKEETPDELTLLQEELDKYKNLYLRTLAEMENFKKRINEERLRERKYAYQGLLEKLVNVIDIFDKAVNIKTDDQKLQNFLTGFAMVNNSFKQILESEEVKKIEALGKEFDPKFHHAVESDYDETKPENYVLEEFQTGYTYKDRILRPSLVKVNLKKKGNDKDE